MERKFLEDQGIEKEVIDKIMAEHGKSVERHKTQLTDLTADRDNLKTQLDDVGKKLGAFEGVDLDALKAEIETLKGDIAKKEVDFKDQLADRDFQALITAGIAEAKGKNPKAITALLDIETLKSSKNQKEDTATALKALAESEAYLFGEADTTSVKNTTPATVKTGGEHTDTNHTSTDPFVVAAMKGAGLLSGKERKGKQNTETRFKHVIPAISAHTNSHAKCFQPPLCGSEKKPLVNWIGTAQGR